MSLDNKKPRSKSGRRLRRKINTSAAISAAVMTAAVGVGAAGYLWYDAYYSTGWHTHAEGTYYIIPGEGERATGMQMISNALFAPRPFALK